MRDLIICLMTRGGYENHGQRWARYLLHLHNTSDTHPKRPIVHHLSCALDQTIRAMADFSFDDEFGYAPILYSPGFVARSGRPDTTCYAEEACGTVCSHEFLGTSGKWRWWFYRGDGDAPGQQ